MNFGVLTTAASGLGLLRSTARGPRDWRLALLWLGWAVSLVLALGTVAENNKEKYGGPQD